MARSNKKRKIKNKGVEKEYCCISEDILFDILVRVPARSVSKLKLVSKQWFDLLSSSDFKMANFEHTKKSHMPELIFSDRVLRDYTSLNMKTREFKTLSLLSFVKNKRIIVLDTLDGLVLFKPYCGRKIYIWNPITRRCEFLISTSPEWKNLYNYKLLFDKELRKYTMIGFGGEGDRYCLLTIKGDESQRGLRRGVPRNDLTWMKVAGVFNGFGDSVIMDGVLHWIVRDDKNSLYIQTMDIMKSELKEKIELPYQCNPNRVMYHRDYILSTENVENCVSVTFWRGVCSRRIEIWILLKDSNDNKKLIKQYDIKFDIEDYFSDGTCIRHWHIIRDNDKEENTFYFVINRYLFSYNVNFSSITQMDVQGGCFNLSYVPSLMSWD